MPNPGGILTLDISLSTGWAYGHPRGAIEDGGVHYFGKMKDKAGHLQLGFLGSCMMQFVEDRLYGLAPSKVVFEAPLTRAQTTDRLLKYLCGAAEIACYEAGVPCYEASAHDARKLIMGIKSFHKPTHGSGKWAKRKVKGKPDQTVLVGDAKEEVDIWCRQNGLEPLDDNHADALVLLRYACVMAASKVMAGAGSAQRST